MEQYGDVTVIAVLLVFQAHYSYEDCRVVQSPIGLQNYWCNSVKELELHGNAQLYDVNIYNGNRLPVLSNATHQRTPNLQVVFADGGPVGLSTDSYKIIKDLSKSVRNNELKSIPKGVFENLPLRKLYLNGNGIQSIQVGAFSNMENLVELSITHNNLRAVETGVFNSLPVETLDLSNNKITVITRNALQNMRNLRNLRLNGNSLTEFRPNSFLSFGTKLETLYLQHNSLTEINRDSVKTLHNLKVLDLASNSISKILIYSFESLLNLEQLVISNNRLQELDENVFAIDGVPSLNKLLLNNNKLSYLTPRLLGRLTGLKSIRLGGNPWECRCFDEIAKWLIENNIKQVCDSDYYRGTKPICVVHDVHSTSCDYSVKANKLFEKYVERVGAIVSSSTCSI